MLRLYYKKSSSGEIRISKKKLACKLRKALLMSVHKSQISTLHFS